MIHHWDTVNPWRKKIIYVDFHTWLKLIHADSRDHYCERYEYYDGKVDCYILPQPSGDHSIGMRYGADGPEYFSPMCADKELATSIISNPRGL